MDYYCTAAISDVPARYRRAFVASQKHMHYHPKCYSSTGKLVCGFPAPWPVEQTRYDAKTRAVQYRRLTAEDAMMEPTLLLTWVKFNYHEGDGEERETEEMSEIVEESPKRRRSADDERDLASHAPEHDASSTRSPPRGTLAAAIVSRCRAPHRGYLFL